MILLNQLLSKQMIFLWIKYSIGEGMKLIKDAGMLRRLLNKQFKNQVFNQLNNHSFKSKDQY